jgi:hypothetical protein
MSPRPGKGGDATYGGEEPSPRQQRRNVVLGHSGSTCSSLSPWPAFGAMATPWEAICLKKQKEFALSSVPCCRLHSLLLVSNSS